ncbi:MAG: DUF2325 domain-containing protein [Clostridia bacterium]|nr:DUF2325 domain-containing protein [Clostridia bacterium]
MSIVIVGGHDRMHCRYKEICKNFGCKCKVFTQCPANFQGKIGNPDVIIVFTKTVAHKMLNVVSSKASQSGITVKYCNSSSAFALKECLTSHLQIS